MNDKYKIFNDIKVDIDEYKEVKFDDANNDAFENKMIKQIRGRKQRNRKKIIAASSVALIGIVSLVAINPEIVKGMPLIGKVIDMFDSSTFGSPVDKYIKYSQDIEMSRTDNNTTISVTDFIIDENMFMIGVMVESDILSGYKGKGKLDFVNIDADILINGEMVQSISQIARQIDDRTGAIILTGNIAELNIGNEVIVDMHIGHVNQGKKGNSGNWEFNFKGDKIDGSQIIDIKKQCYIKGQELVVESLVKSPISNTLILSGIDDTKKYTLQSTNFKVVDDKGNILRADIIDSSVDNYTGRFSAKIHIRDDLSNTSYIELVPYWGMDTILKEEGGVYHELLTTTGKGDREKIVISRKTLKEELENGYQLDNVYYYLNIDKNKEFLSIDELIGYEIPVNNKGSVIVKNIEADDKSTKITMQVKGHYEHLSQLVLFDENMNDTKVFEGNIGATLEDEKEKIYSITLDKIDKSKKYKIAIPQTKDIDLGSKDNIRIDL